MTTSQVSARRGVAHRVGYAFGAAPWWMWVALALLALALVAPGLRDELAVSQQAEQDTANASQSAASAAAEFAADCGSRANSLKAEHAALMREGKFDQAAHAIGPCARALHDQDLLRLQKDAAVKFHLAKVNDKKASPGERAAAIESFAGDHPEAAKPYLGQVAALKERQQSTNAAAEKKRRKTEGVSVGMTAQEVLDSSWGRPSDVNSTTTAGGTSEQWVYDGGYLYLTNGVLTAIQN